MSGNNKKESLKTAIARAVADWAPAQLVIPEERHRVYRKGFQRDTQATEEGYRTTLVVRFDHGLTWVEIEALFEIEVSDEGVRWKVWGDSHLLDPAQVEKFKRSVEPGLLEVLERLKAGEIEA